jgi:hypothetical protein
MEITNTGGDAGDAGSDRVEQSGTDKALKLSDLITRLLFRV